jgi:hypothetical protein
MRAEDGLRSTFNGKDPVDIEDSWKDELIEGWKWACGWWWE